MEQREMHLARLEAGIGRLVEALHAVRQERDAARAELQTLRASAQQELARLHTTVEHQESELSALRLQGQVVGERLRALQGRLDTALAEEPTAAASPAGRNDDATPAPAVEELTLQ